MTDAQLSDLFAEGSAPESDSDFALRVAAEIGRARLGDRLRAQGLRAIVALALSGAALLAAGLVKAALAPLAEEAPQIMGAPAPVVLVVLLAGLALSARRYVLSR